MDLPPRLAPVDAGIVAAAAALIGREAVVLFDARRLASLHEVDGLEHRIDAHRKQPVEIHRAERIVGADRRLLLQQHRTGIEAIVGPEDRQSGLGFALDDRPVDRARSAEFRQQGGMVLNRAVGRNVEKLFRHEQGDERHHLQVGLERAEFLPHLGLAIRGGLIDRKLGGERRLLERVGLLAWFLGRAIDRDHVLAALDERFEHGLAERLLAMNDDPHGYSLRSFLASPCFAGRGSHLLSLRRDARLLRRGDRARCLDVLEFLARITEHFAEDFVGVLAEQR